MTVRLRGAPLLQPGEHLANLHALALFALEAMSAQTTTLAVLNARVWTANPDMPWAEAVAISDENIVAVGSNAAIRALAGNRTRLIDARGGMVTPGFIDSHVHFLIGGMNLASVQLRDASSRQEFVSRIQAFAATLPPGAWITGGDWDHRNWRGELPSKDWIDPVTPRNPLWINRLDGHMSLANSRALEAAGITTSTPEVSGGATVRTTAGEPSGIFKDNAKSLVDRVVPPPTQAMMDRALDAAMKFVAARGVTSVHHMGDWSDLAVFERAVDTSRLRTRIYAAVPLADWERLKQLVAVRGRGNDWLGIGALKGFVDGSLGSHTAAFLAPFTDAPEDTGLLVNTPEDLYRWTAAATQAGLQVVVHAIGDRAIRLQLDIFERVGHEQHPLDPRFRIEHAQHIAPSDIGRFAALGVIAGMQPYHAIDDGRWAESVIGPERSQTSYFSSQNRMF